MQVALAWLLQRAPNILLIPGTSSVAHLRENLKSAELKLPDEALARLDAIAEEGCSFVRCRRCRDDVDQRRFRQGQMSGVTEQDRHRGRSEAIQEMKGIAFGPSIATSLRFAVTAMVASECGKADARRPSSHRHPAAHRRLVHLRARAGEHDAPRSMTA